MKAVEFSKNSKKFKVIINIDMTDQVIKSLDDSKQNLADIIAYAFSVHLNKFAKNLVKNGLGDFYFKFNIERDVK